MIKLYGGARSRASIIQWYLEELGVAYEFVLLDMQAGEHLKPEYLEINPGGKVPAIVDGALNLWESGAILLYLQEKYGKSELSLEQRSILNQWILYANATMGPGIFAEATRDREFPRHMAMLNQHFEQHPFVVGEELTAADAAVGSLLMYIPMMLKLNFDEYPAVAEYAKRLAERPAFQKTIGARS